MVFTELWAGGASSGVRTCAPKWRRVALWAGNEHEVNRETVFNTRAHQPRCGFFVDGAYRRCSLQNGPAPFSAAYEASKSVSHDQPRVNGQRLAPPRESIRLSMNMRIVQSSSCIERKPAVMPCFTRHPLPTFSLDHVRPSTELKNKPNQNLLLLTSRPSIFHLWAWLAHTNPGRWGFSPTWTCSCLIVVGIVVGIKTYFFHGWLVNTKT